MTETVYQTTETITLEATITDSAGAAVDPTTVVISVMKPDGTLDVDGVAMTKDSVGSYHYDYTIPSDVGTYKSQVKATGATSKVTVEPDTFLVEASI